MWPFRKKPGLLPGPQPVCLHEHWMIGGSERIGCCTCLDCGGMIPLDRAFNMLHDRMEKVIRECEEKLRRLP